MFQIIGLVLLFGLVFGSYLMSGGKLDVIIEAAPHELMAIGGAGIAAGHALAERAHALGWQVSLLPAPDGFDWNDILQERRAARTRNPVSGKPPSGPKGRNRWCAKSPQVQPIRCTRSGRWPRRWKRCRA